MGYLLKCLTLHHNLRWHWEKKCVEYGEKGLDKWRIKFMRHDVDPAFPFWGLSGIWECLQNRFGADRRKGKPKEYPAVILQTKIWLLMSWHGVSCKRPWCICPKRSLDWEIGQMEQPRYNKYNNITHTKFRTGCSMWQKRSSTSTSKKHFKKIHQKFIKFSRVHPNHQLKNHHFQALSRSPGASRGPSPSSRACSAGRALSTSSSRCRFLSPEEWTPWGKQGPFVSKKRVLEKNLFQTNEFLMTVDCFYFFLVIFWNPMICWDIFLISNIVSFWWFLGKWAGTLKLEKKKHPNLWLPTSTAFFFGTFDGHRCRRSSGWRWKAPRSGSAPRPGSAGSSCGRRSGCRCPAAMIGDVSNKQPGFEGNLEWPKRMFPL